MGYYDRDTNAFSYVAKLVGGLTAKQIAVFMTVSCLLFLVLMLVGGARGASSCTIKALGTMRLDKIDWRCPTG